MTRPRRVVYVHNSSQIGGGNKVLLGLIDHIDRGRFEPQSVLPDRGPMERELARRGVPHHVVPSARALTSTSWLPAVSYALALARVLLPAPPALLHANGVLSYRYASVVARWTAIRRLCHIHHPGEVRGAEWALRVRPHLVVTPSHAMQEEVARHLATLPNPPEVIQVTNSVDTAAFAPVGDRARARQDLGLDRFSFVACIVGSVTEHKGHRLFLEMARRILQKHPAAGFLVVGEDVENGGRYRHEMERYAASLGIEKSVVFYGFVADEKARMLMSTSDVFVLPTREEGFGLVLAEAQACGVPVVSTRIGPTRQVVADGETGVLVPVDDVSSLTEAVMSLLADPDLRKTMGERGRERARRLFSHERFAREMEELYESQLAKTTSPWVRLLRR
jgi:glycosyltransferase involved in cell wall biosynthesis